MALITPTIVHAALTTKPCAIAVGVALICCHFFVFLSLFQFIAAIRAFVTWQLSVVLCLVFVFVSHSWKYIQYNTILIIITNLIIYLLVMIMIIWCNSRWSTHSTSLSRSNCVYVSAADSELIRIKHWTPFMSVNAGALNVSLVWFLVLRWP